MGSVWRTQRERTLAPLSAKSSLATASNATSPRSSSGVIGKNGGLITWRNTVAERALLLVRTDHGDAAAAGGERREERQPLDVVPVEVGEQHGGAVAVGCGLRRRGRRRSCAARCRGRTRSGRDLRTRLRRTRCCPRTGRTGGRRTEWIRVPPRSSRASPRTHRTRLPGATPSTSGRAARRCWSRAMCDLLHTTDRRRSRLAGNFRGHPDRHSSDDPDVEREQCEDEPSSLGRRAWGSSPWWPCRRRRSHTSPCSRARCPRVRATFPSVSPSPTRARPERRR